MTKVIHVEYLDHIRDVTVNGSSYFSYDAAAAWFHQDISFLGTALG